MQLFNVYSTLAVKTCFNGLLFKIFEVYFEIIKFFLQF
jgi:hypothetical protein